jgi:hypothetical protein
MKLTLKSMLISAMAVSAVAANAVVYTDATGDLTSPMPFGNNNLDIASLEITNTATTISFKWTTAGTTLAGGGNDWGKYLVLIRRPGASSLDTSPTGNGWGRRVTLAGGSDRYLGGWVDGGGGVESRSFDGTNWGTLNAASYTSGASISISGNTYTQTVNLSNMGLAIGDTFTFDGATTGGTGSDGAWDLLSMSTPSAANTDSFVVSNSNLTYTVVPEPATMTILGLGLAAIARRRKA